MSYPSPPITTTTNNLRNVAGGDLWHVSVFFPPTVGVDLAGHLEGLGRGHVCVGGGDGQDDGVGVGDVLQDELLDLDLNVFGLVTYWHLKETTNGNTQTYLFCERE